MAEHKPFSVSLVTPDGPAYEGDAEMVIVPGAAGEIGVLARHAPLIATLCMELLLSELPQARVTAFDYRAAAPLFDTAPFSVCGRQAGTQAELWAENAAGEVAMSVSAVL